jgi:quinoprotein glucose dehydrogenase
MVHHDVWDYDTPAQPTLVDLEVNGEIVPAVIQVTKMGLTFALHRDTGKPLWPVEERPVPSVSSIPEEQGLSPTQPFPSHIPQLLKPPLTGDDAWGMLLWDRLRCADLIDSLDNQGWYTPPSTRGSVHFPVSAGGNNWGSPAIDPDSRVMVVYTTRVPGYIKLVPREDCEGSFQPQAGTPYCVETGFLMSPLGVPCTAPPWGTLDAIDLEAGKLLWSTPMGSSRDIAPFPLWWLQGIPGIGGPMITSSGLVFSGVSNEHAFRAFSLETGAELWKVRLPTAANAVPMTYQLRPDGRQFVVVAAGGHWSGGSPPGDYLIAYALPEKP